MQCPYCNSTNITQLKVYILKPIGATKNKCLQCNQTFIEQKNNNLTQNSYNK